jgi:alkylation response protein AidB-like acyl-CoA dehydrogenase
MSTTETAAAKHPGEPDELAAFRLKARTWLDENLPRYSGGDRVDSRAFRTALWDAGLLGITLDTAYGGQGLSPAFQRVFAEESRGRSMPAVGEAVTTGICAPTLLDFGTERRRSSTCPA